MDFNSQLFNLDIETFAKIIDAMYDEVLIYDGNYNIAYINQACSRHYCCSPKEMIGKNFFDFIEDKWWEPSVLPLVYKNKKSYAIKQTVYTGKELLTIAVPIFDQNNEIKYVVMNVRDEVKEKDIVNASERIETFYSEKMNTPVFKSKIMTELMELIKKISTVNVNVILLGESGTGKTMYAQFLHSISDRKDKPFVSINCASIPQELLESELFGYAKGAFTGAKTQGKKGLFEIAHEGILFLDEITELSLSAQAKLLHVLQNGEFLPLGATVPVKVNVRIIAATNKNLKNLVNTGNFREDLYYRLNVVEIYIPPLRSRKNDILPLINFFLIEFNKKYNVTRYFSETALSILKNYKWQGNVRELKHVVERLVITSDTMIIDASMLPKTLFNIVDEIDDKLPSQIQSFDSAMNDFEEKLVKRAYAKNNTSRKLAKYFMITQTRANKLIRKHITNNTGF